VIIIPVRTRPWSKRYTLAAINHGFICDTKIKKQRYPMIPAQYRIVDFGLIGNEPFIINFFMGPSSSKSDA
jgi:hypothetical protein